MTEDELKRLACEYTNKIYADRRSNPIWSERTFFGEDVTKAFIAGAELLKARVAELEADKERILGKLCGPAGVERL